MSNKTKPISFIISSPAADARSRVPQRRVTVDRPLIMVGSRATAHVHIDDPGWSMMHAMVEWCEDGTVWWVDLGTPTKSLVDGRVVFNHKVQIADRSIVQIGDTKIEIEIPGSVGDATGSAFAVAEKTMERVKLWDAIALVIEASGGTLLHAASGGVAKQNAVDSVEKAIDELIKRERARARFLERTRAGGDPATAGPLDPLAVFDLTSFFNEKRRWSEETFGPGDRYAGVVEHIRKELDEILEKPDDLVEWIDVVLLAMDGAWRSAGADGERFVRTLTEKQEKNTRRSWPDWRTLRPNQVSEHVAEASPTGNGAAPAVERMVYRPESEKVRHALEVTRDERDQLRATLKKARELARQLNEAQTAAMELLEKQR